MNYTKIRQEIEREQEQQKELGSVEEFKDILNKEDIDLFM